jgi:hypothetical protein
MAKVNIYESVDGKVNLVELEQVDAREAVQNDPDRWSYTKPGKKAEPGDGPVQPRYKVEHAGNKKYNVIDTANGEIIESGWDQAAANAKAAELGGGHATTSPNT